MAKYSIESSTLTGLADKVRTLTGETSTLTPSAMGTQLDNANTEVNEQGDLLEQLEAAVEALPEGGAGGVELPELTNPAAASEIGLNKEAIDAEGNKITGTFTLDDEIDSQEDLISQIAAALDGKAAGSGTIDTCKVIIDNQRYNVGARINTLFYSTLVDGKITGIYENVVDTGYEDITAKKELETVCGTAFYVFHTGDSLATHSISYDDNTIIIINDSSVNSEFITPTTPNSTVTVTIYYD